MSSPEDREKHSSNRKRNIYDKMQRTGAPPLKVEDPRKLPYKRVRLDTRNITTKDFEDDD